MALALRALVVFKWIIAEKDDVQNGGWRVWLVKRFPSVELRVLAQPALPESDEALANQFLPLPRTAKDLGVRFVMRALTLNNSPEFDLVLDELLMDLLALLQTCAPARQAMMEEAEGGADLTHKLAFMRMLASALPFGTPTGRQILSTPSSNGPSWNPAAALFQQLTSKPSLASPTTCLVWQEDWLSIVQYKDEFHSRLDHCIKCTSSSNGGAQACAFTIKHSIKQLRSSSDCVQRVDQVHLVFSPNQPSATLAQWQSHSVPNDLPLTIAYRLRRAEQGYHLVLKLTPTTTTSLEDIEIRLHLPSAIVNYSNLKLTGGGKITARDKSNVLVLTPDKNIGAPMLLQGLVQCENDTAAAKAGETSCAQVTFTSHRDETELETSKGELGITIGKRVLRVKQYVIWNPFGELPQGSFAHAVQAIKRISLIE